MCFTPLPRASPSGKLARPGAVTEGVSSGTNPLSLAALDSQFPFLSPGGERVASRTNPLSRLRRQLSRRESPWQRGQVSSSFVNDRTNWPVKHKLYASAKASPFRERWHGEAVTERVACGTNPFRHFALRNATSPFCRLAATSSPGRGKSFHSGGGLGKEDKSRPH